MIGSGYLVNDSLTTETQIVRNNKPFGDPRMPTIFFGKRQRFPNVSSISLTQSIIPAFHVRRFSGIFTDTAVCFDRKHCRICLPEIAETDAGAIRPGNPMPEPPTGACTVVADDKGDNLARPTT
jgi:hypothetical protein